MRRPVHDFAVHYQVGQQHHSQVTPAAQQLQVLTLKECLSQQLMSWTLLNRIITAQWEGMGDVGSARYEPALLPPCPTIRVLSYSNCQRSTHSIS